MSDVEWIDVTGLGLLAAAHERQPRRGDHLVLLHPSPGLRRTLAVTRLGRVLAVACVTPLTSRLPAGHLGLRFAHARQLPRPARRQA